MTNAQETRKSRIFEQLQLLDDFSMAHQFADDGFIQSITNENFRVLGRHHRHWLACDCMPNIVLYEADSHPKNNTALMSLLDSEPDPVHREAIESCANMHFGLEPNGRRCSYLFIASEEAHPASPIGYICFTFSILNQWETIEGSSGSDEIALCLHMIHLYVKTQWRHMGIAHCLSDIALHRFATQLQCVSIQLKSHNITLVPLVYEGIRCAGAEHIIQDCEYDLTRYIKFMMERMHLNKPLSNVS
ncbi:hypothetical protein [Shewanella sp. GXUN23E]|uniref:hypothetical protein n=1 Tax=Shewanella sp. GXUN23E TaxID=3422498 RepID=UPI003D7DE081